MVVVIFVSNNIGGSNSSNNKNSSIVVIIEVVKGSLEDTSELRRVEKRCDWKGEGSRGDVN